MVPHDLHHRFYGDLTAMIFHQLFEPVLTEESIGETGLVAQIVWLQIMGQEVIGMGQNIAVWQYNAAFDGSGFHIDNSAVLIGHHMVDGHGIFSLGNSADGIGQVFLAQDILLPRPRSEPLPGT